MLHKSNAKPTDPSEMWENAQPEEQKETSQLEEKKPVITYYSLKNIMSKGCVYNLIFGERSNGKTYACLKVILERYIKNGEQGALIRRWKEDFRGKRGQAMFEAFSEGEIYRLTGGQYSTTYYYSGKWFLANVDDAGEKLIPAAEPFCWGFALSDVEHDKSTSYPRITTIFFDEFLTRQYYLPDEFVTFMNVVSTIVRQRDNVKIYMAGNTVNRYCPYFTEMGLKHIQDMKKGAIEVYTYGSSRLKVAVEYADSISEKGKPSDVYFAFDNPKLEMITGGAWEIAMYPHLPKEAARNSNTLLSYFMEFNNELLQCDIMQSKLSDGSVFTFVHRKTTPIQNTNKDIIVTFDDDIKPNYIRNLLKSQNKIARKLKVFFTNDKVFYQDNEVGEIVRNYMVQCMHDTKQ